MSIFRRRRPFRKVERVKSWPEPDPMDDFLGQGARYRITGRHREAPDKACAIAYNPNPDEYIVVLDWQNRSKPFTALLVDRQALIGAGGQFILARLDEIRDREE